MPRLIRKSDVKPKRKDQVSPLDYSGIRNQKAIRLDLSSSSSDDDNTHDYSVNLSMNTFPDPHSQLYVDTSDSELSSAVSLASTVEYDSDFVDNDSKRIDVIAEVERLPRPKTIPSFAQKQNRHALENMLGSNIMLDHDPDNISTLIVRSHLQEPLSYSDRNDRLRPRNIAVLDEAREKKKIADSGSEDSSDLSDSNDGSESDHSSEDISDLSNDSDSVYSYVSDVSSEDSVEAPTYNPPLKHFKCPTEERKLKEYQMKPAEYALHQNQRGMLIVQKAGAGKTLTGLNLINNVMRDEVKGFTQRELVTHRPSRWIIFCPKSLKKQWESELEQANLCNVTSSDGIKAYLEYVWKYRDLIDVIGSATDFCRLPAEKLSEKYLLFDEVQNFRYVQNDEKGKKAKTKSKKNQKLSFPESQVRYEQDGDAYDNPELEDNVLGDDDDLGLGTKNAAEAKRTKIEVTGRVTMMKKAFIMTATPIIGRIGEMASYYWMLTKQSLSRAPSEDELSQIALRIETEGQKDQMNRWRCLITFNLNMKQDKSFPAAKDDQIEVPFDDTENEEFEKKFENLSTKVRESFYHKETQFCNSRTKMTKVVELCENTLQIEQAKMIIISRFVRERIKPGKNTEGKPPLGLSLIYEYLAKKPNLRNTCLNLSRISTTSEARRAIVAFNNNETYRPIWKKPVQQNNETKRAYEKRLDKARRAYQKLLVALPAGPARILLIGPKNSVGTDLSGVTHVILLEPAWYEGHTIQHIGRAIRKNALSMIKKEKNSPLFDEKTALAFVQVYRMIATRKRKVYKWEDYLRDWAISRTDIVSDRLLPRPTGVTADQLAVARSQALNTKVKNYLDDLKPISNSMPSCK